MNDASNARPYNISYMSPIFADVAELLRHGLADLGHQVFVGSATIGVDCRNVFLGAHLVQDLSQLPDDSVIFNLEQLGSASTLLKQPYLDCLHRHHVWDYSPRNIAWLRNHGIDASLVKLGFAPTLARVPHGAVQDIDVLFYGSVNERREAVLGALRASGLHVVVLAGVVQEELDTYIARSKVVLNVHYYETKIFEIVRVSYLLNNRKAVVTEIDPDTEIEDELRPALLGVPYDGLVEACRALVADAARRHRLEQDGAAIFAARAQGGFMRDAVRQAISFDASRKRAGHGAAPLARRIRLTAAGGKRGVSEDVVTLAADDAAADLPRGYFRHIVADDVLQQVPDLVMLMGNCLDLLEVGGVFEISVPYDLSHGAWQHPGNVRAFNETSWQHYTDGFWQLAWREARFENVGTNVQFSQYGLQLQAGNMALEQIMRQPRAIDRINVQLRKRLLNSEEKAAVQRFLESRSEGS